MRKIYHKPSTISNKNQDVWRRNALRILIFKYLCVCCRARDAFINTYFLYCDSTKHCKIISEKFQISLQQSLTEIKTIGEVVLSQLSNEWLHKWAACLYDIPVTLAVAVFFEMLLVLDDLLPRAPERLFVLKKANYKFRCIASGNVILLLY